MLPLVKTTNVYVDGFNLYCGAVKGTPYKWLDVRQMCVLLFPKNKIQRIRYFTAITTDPPHDPHHSLRQKTFIRALETIPGLTVHYGSFLSNVTRMPLASPPADRERPSILNPHPRFSIELSKVATFKKKIRAGVLGASQLPPTLNDSRGTITKPAGW